MATSILDRLPEELLRHILDFAMARDSPFQIDYAPPDPNETNHIGNMPVGVWYWPPLLLESSTGSTDPLSIATVNGCPHLRSRRADHVADWIVVNSTSRLIRRVGREAFFGAKVIAMRSTLPCELLQPGRVKRGFARILGASASQNPRRDLALIRDLVFVDAKEQAPTAMMALPDLLNLYFPALRRCTLLFGYRENDDPEWVTAAVAVSSPMRKQLKELLVGIGVPGRLALEETMGTGTSWDENNESMEKYIYPILNFKVMALENRRREADEFRRSVLEAKGR